MEDVLKVNVADLETASDFLRACYFLPPSLSLSNIDVFCGVAKIEISSLRIRASEGEPGSALCPKCEARNSDGGLITKKPRQ